MGVEGGGRQEGRHAFSLKAAIGRTVHCLGLDQKSVNIVVPPNRRAHGGTAKLAPLWLSGSGGSYSNSSCSSSVPPTRGV